MSMDEISRTAFALAGQASVNVTNALTADVNTYALSSATAVLVANRPTNAQMYQIPVNDGHIDHRVRVLINDAAVDGKDGRLRLWTFDAGTGGGYLLGEWTCTGGSGLVVTHPVMGETLASGQWSFADTIVEVSNRCNAELYGASGASADANGIAEIRTMFHFDPWIFADFDCDAGSAACDDMMVICKGY